MEDISDILTRAADAFVVFDEAKKQFDLAQSRVNSLAREYSLATKTYAFKDYMLRKEVNACLGLKRA